MLFSYVLRNDEMQDGELKMDDEFNDAKLQMTILPYGYQDYPVKQAPGYQVKAKSML